MPTSDPWWDQFPEDSASMRSAAVMDASRVGAGESANYNATIPGDLARMGVRAIPGAMALGGAALGGMTGPAAPYFSPLLAGMGGVAGRWAEYGLSPYVGLDTPQPTMADARNEAILNAVLAGGGSLVRMGAENLAEPAARTGLKLPPTWREQWQELVPGNETPEQFMIRTRNITRQSARRYARAASGREARLTRAAERAGETISPAQLSARSISEAQAVKPRLTAADRSRIIRDNAKLADELLQIRGRGATPRAAVRPGGALADYPPTQVRNIKQSAQAMKRGKFGGNVNLSANPDDIVDLSRSAREALRSLPGVGPATTEAQKAWNLTRMLSRAEARQRTSLPQIASAVVGGGAGMGAGGDWLHHAAGTLIGAGLGHTLSSPEAFRRYALLLSNPTVLRSLEYAPLGVSALARPIFTPRNPIEPTVPDTTYWNQFPADTTGGYR